MNKGGPRIEISMSMPMDGSQTVGERRQDRLDGLSIASTSELSIRNAEYEARMCNVNAGEVQHIAQTSKISPVERESTETSIIGPASEKEFLTLVCEDKESASVNKSKKEDGSRSFECTECVASFSLVEDLFIHMRVHSEERPHRCKFCGAAFTHIGNLKRHIRRHTGEKPYKCSICDVAFTQKEHLKNHTKIHTDEKPHKCNYCNAAFAHTGNLKRHTRTHTGEKPYKCLICEVAFTQKEHLKNHSKICSEEKPHACTFCDAAFSRIRLLKDHVRVAHTKEKLHKCTGCNAAFTRLEQLNCHMRVHSGQHPLDVAKREEGPTSLESNGALALTTNSGIKPHRCRHCDAVFTCSGDLKIHIRTHTKERPHKCTFCDATFSHTGNLKRHVRTHTGEKPYKCLVCQAAFTQKEHLKNHTKTHGDEKVKCTQHDASFLHDGLLKDHMNSQTETEKLYKCPICETAFLTPEQLECHSRMHRGERPFEYPMFDTEFIQKELKYDMTHTSDKPHKNPYCDDLFSQMGLLGNARTYTQEKPHQCTYCDAVFPQAVDLKNHMRIHNVGSSYKWSQFDADFSLVKGLKNHYETHVGQNPYRCNSTLSLANSLSENAQIHSDEQPYKCTICHATFSHQGALNEHVRTHAGGKSDKGNLWGSTIPQAENLQHFRTHLGEWSNECTYFNAAFSQSGSLNKHVRLPSGEKPYKCTMCCAAFSTTKNLKEHARTHIGEQLFACSICNKSFSQTQSLKKHVRTHIDQIYGCAVTSFDLMKYMALCGNQLPKPFANVSFGGRLGGEPANTHAVGQDTPGGSMHSVSRNVNMEVKVEEHDLEKEFRSKY